jgi:hypothetical protein
VVATLEIWNDREEILEQQEESGVARMAKSIVASRLSERTNTKVAVVEGRDYTW